MRYGKRTGRFRSKLEHKIWNERPKPRGVKAEYETELLYYSIPKRYKPDFIFTRRNGTKVYVEVKGFFRQEDKQKMKAVKSCHPDLDIRMVFGYYSDENKAWCEKNGFPFAVGHVPKEWLSG